MSQLNYAHGGVTYAVNVTGSGKFLATVDGESLEAATYDALKDKIKKAAAQTELALPFICVRLLPINYGVNRRRVEVLKGTARGIHGNRRNAVKVTWENGEKATIGGYDGYDTTYLPGDVDPTVLVEALEARIAADEAADAARKELGQVQITDYVLAALRAKD